MVSIQDVLDPTDINIYRDLAGGLTTANVLHGSANPIGGGNHNIEIIRDGDFPPLDSTDSQRQYDTWDGVNTASEDWIGYVYPTDYTFRRVVFPNILPGILSGVALAFAKAVGEFGSLVIITGNLPFKTEVSSVFIFGRIESGDEGGAAAASVVILAITFGILLVIGGFRRWATRHDR